MADEPQAWQFELSGKAARRGLGKNHDEGRAG